MEASGARVRRLGASGVVRLDMHNSAELDLIYLSASGLVALLAFFLRRGFATFGSSPISAPAAVRLREHSAVLASWRSYADNVGEVVTH
jgi:hypothetical protein